MKKFTLLFMLLLICTFVEGVAQQRVTVTGRVSSAEDKQPLAGVTISVKGTSTGVTTLTDGTYSIVTNAGSVLEFSYIGMKSAEHAIVPSKENNGKVTINVAMEPDRQQLEDVVVVAYGVRKKGTLSGSVATVKADKINNVPAAGFDQALQGQAAGLTVLSNTGEPSAPASFKIRGTNSINSGTNPLFILDGIAISPDDFSTISPSDIESVTVLKDASSTSIYGARAANGVIVITTKRGKMGEKGRITFRTQLGFSDLAYGKWDLMNTAERIQYEKEIGIDAGKNYEVLGRTDIDWREAVYRDNAPIRNYELSVSGASDKFNYFVSGGYYKQQGITVGSDFARYTIRTNMEARPTNWMKIGTNTSLSREEISEAEEGQYTLETPISAARFMLPYISPYRADGSIASVSDGTWTGPGENPLEWSANNLAGHKKNKVLSTLYIEIEPIKNLKIRSTGGVDATDFISEMRSMPSYLPNNEIGLVGRGASRMFNLTISNTINYMFDVNEHSFNFMLGQEAIDNQSEGFSVTSRGQNNDKLMSLSTASAIRDWNDTNTSSSYLSFFARGEYNYQSKYYIEASVRRDGSSKFGKNSRWANFWSLGLMWNAKSESFLQDVDWLTNAQIAVSTGTSGNSSIPAYDHLALIGGGPQYAGTQGMAPIYRGNENLTWEKLHTTNLAFHLGFFGRLNADIELYNKKTTDMLMSVPTSFSTGYAYQWDNIGAMVNRGAELSINYDVIRSKEVLWNISANVSYNHNEITELYNGLDQYVMSTTGIMFQVGHPSSEFYVNRYAGVNPANGDALWYTKDGSIINEIRDEDKVMLGKCYEAPWQGGFGTSISYKGVSLSAQFSWVADRWMMNNDRYFDESNGPFQAFNQSRKLLDRWKNPGDIAEIPRHGLPTYLDSHLLEDASFLRLKNLAISYSLPQTLLSRTKFFEQAKIFAQAQNLFTFTKFSGLDPESSANMYQAQYPMSRQFTFGIELTF